MSRNMLYPPGHRRLRRLAPAIWLAVALLLLAALLTYAPQPATAIDPTAQSAAHADAPAPA